ncbi:MAG: hypothetical protein OXP36_12210 [Gammaproteobacteria bacterium]|nr:hypothetical protein [Gammaproteobacteria bacterium]
MAAVALCCLAGTLLTAPDGPWNAPGITLAAEQDEAPTSQSESNEPATKAPAEASKDGEDRPPDEEPAQSEADESDEIFVPSEDISEDIDVPFPVDI